MRIRFVPSALLAIAAVSSAVGCRKHESGVGQAHASTTQQPQGKPAAAPPGSGSGSPEEEESNNPLAAIGQGAKKWRDTGVYVDGRPVGVLSFGELPITLKPVWVEEEHSIEFGPDDKGPRTSKSVARRYRFTELLTALGVDLGKVKTIHVLGPKMTEVISASGKELRARGKEFMFRFGANTGGKAIPVVPLNFGNHVKPDKIAAVMVYIDKKPPEIVQDEGMVLDGKPIDGIPYYGDPLRGGIRVYQDDRLAMTIKRPMLRETTPLPSTDGKQRYKLWPLLVANGVDVSKVVEGWTIADETRKQRLTRAQLEELTFQIGAKEKNELLIDGTERVNALALHARKLVDADLPKLRPEEQQN
ncbi:MAG: hypothetical protein JWN44_2333 [Myxococcales bacterium]|nr:hypothetical protein [Myxococcales bacterium]